MSTLMEERLLMQFKSSPNLIAIVQALEEEIEELTQVFSDLKTKRWVSTATGYNLDICGEIVDRSRTISEAIAISFFGFDDQTATTGFSQSRLRYEVEHYRATSILNDTEYRTALYAKIAKNSTTGTVDAVLTNYTNIFGATTKIAELGSGQIAVSIGKELTDNEILLADAMDLFIKGAGIGIKFRSTYVKGSTFGFYDSAGNYTGFGQGTLSQEF